MPKEHVEKVLDSMKTLNLADAKGQLRKDEIIKTYATISTFFASSIGKAILSAAAGAAVKSTQK